MAGEATPTEIILKIPCKPEFVGIARLTVLGVASRMPFSYDEVEDVRLAVGEACTTAVQRALKSNQTDTEIAILSSISDGRLVIEVADHAGPITEPAETGQPAEDLDEQSLGALLMELLVDEFTVEPTEDGTLVTMVKYSG